MFSTLLDDIVTDIDVIGPVERMARETIIKINDQGSWVSIYNGSDKVRETIVLFTTYSLQRKVFNNSQHTLVFTNRRSSLSIVYERST